MSPWLDERVPGDLLGHQDCGISCEPEIAVVEPSSKVGWEWLGTVQNERRAAGWPDLNEN